MRMRLDAAMTIAALVVFGGCDGGEKKGDADSPKDKPAASAAADVSDEAVDAAEIPTEEDFEDEAFEAINADNLDAEVDKLAAEIDEG